MTETRQYSSVSLSRRGCLPNQVLDRFRFSTPWSDPVAGSRTVSMTGGSPSLARRRRIVGFTAVVNGSAASSQTRSSSSSADTTRPPRGEQALEHGELLRAQVQAPAGRGTRPGGPGRGEVAVRAGPAARRAWRGGPAPGRGRPARRTRTAWAGSRRRPGRARRPGRRWCRRRSASAPGSPSRRRRASRQTSSPCTPGRSRSSTTTS